MLLTTAYFPPIEYFAILAKYSSVYMEACENYQKQSYRNRCRILTANGVEALNVPVVHEGGTFSLPIKEIKLEYSTPWVLRTERAIESAYYSSPFFIYYKDELFEILDSHPATLWELNRRLIDFFCRKIGIAPTIKETTSFIAAVEGSCSSSTVSEEHVPSAADLREVIHPKRPNTIMRDLGLERPYWQVFRDKYGFVPGLSIMDLLFNEGPESICWLR
ncbi:MAG: WbqC family protein [Bacteroidales bacterium]|nr:WbqC family protein [Bacteroidales bacterium]